MRREDLEWPDPVFPADHVFDRRKKASRFVPAETHLSQGNLIRLSFARSAVGRSFEKHHNPK
jgi:hypothetical protein